MAPFGRLVSARKSLIQGTRERRLVDVVKSVVKLCFCDSESDFDGHNLLGKWKLNRHGPVAAPPHIFYLGKTSEYHKLGMIVRTKVLHYQSYSPI